MYLHKVMLRDRLIQQELFWSSNGNIADDPDFQPFKDQITTVFPTEDFNEVGHIYGIPTAQATYLKNTIVAHNCIKLPILVPQGILDHPNYDTLYSYSILWDLVTGKKEYHLWWNAINFGHPLIDEIPIDLDIAWFGLHLDENFTETGEVMISVTGDVNKINEYISSKGGDPLALPISTVDSPNSITLHYTESTGALTDVMPWIMPERFSVKGEAEIFTTSWVSQYATNKVDALIEVQRDSRGFVLGRADIPRRPKSFKLQKSGNGFIRVPTQPV